MDYVGVHLHASDESSDRADPHREEGLISRFIVIDQYLVMVYSKHIILSYQRQDKFSSFQLDVLLQGFEIISQELLQALEEVLVMRAVRVIKP